MAPVVRYERAQPGELIHIDIKKLGRFEIPGHRVTGSRSRASHGRYGWEYVFVVIDDHSRLAHAAIFPSERDVSATAFLRKAPNYYQRFGVRVQRLVTDNGSCFRSKFFAEACRQLGIKHIKTKRYTPKTNGKAERFIQSSLALNPPISRIPLTENNLLILHI